MRVKISRVDASLPLPQFETEGSFGFDLLVREDTEICPGETALIPGNIIVECPTGLALLILPRSSTYRKTGLTFPHSIGLIDRDYSGPEDEIKIQVQNNAKKTVFIKRGEKIAQGLFVQSPKIQFEEVDRTKILAKNSRGGFGSTDMKTS
jgi:dUTP pyrophosphatase